MTLGRPLYLPVPVSSVKWTTGPTSKDHGDILMTFTICKVHRMGPGPGKESAIKRAATIYWSWATKCRCLWVGRVGRKQKREVRWDQGQSDSACRTERGHQTQTTCTATFSVTLAGLEAEETGVTSALPRDPCPGVYLTASEEQNAPG